MTTEHNEKLKKSDAILFPHSYLPGSARNRLLDSFSPITVCQPWFMESDALLESNNGTVTIMHPPEELKPPGDFKRLLSENRLWMRQNRGHSAFLHTGTGEDATWEIRESIRKTGDAVAASAEENTLKWHLILHLERELEADRTSAEEMLIQMKGKKSPLEEALGEANTSQGLFEDLPLSEAHPSIDERHLKQVLAAWFGLFGGSLQDDSILLTLDSHVMDYATGLFEAETLKPSKKKEEPFLQTVYLPVLSIDSHLREDPVSTGLSGKTLILTECE